jgi:hypothetical protein
MFGDLQVLYLNLGCLHPVACVRSGDGGFIRLRKVTIVYLILLLTLLHVSVVRPSSSRNILLARITQLTTGPLFLEHS